MGQCRRTCLKTRPVRAPGLQEWPNWAIFCRPRALTRRFCGVFKQARRHPARSRAYLIIVAGTLCLTSRLCPNAAVLATRILSSLTVGTTYGVIRNR